MNNKKIEDVFGPKRVKLKLIDNEYQLWRPIEFVVGPSGVCAHERCCALVDVVATKLCIIFAKLSSNWQFQLKLN